MNLGEYEGMALLMCIWRVQMQKPQSGNDHFYQACIFKFSDFT